MTPSPWLKRYCARHLRSSHWMSSPFCSGAYSVVTNGRVLVALRDHGASVTDGFMFDPSTNVPPKERVAPYLAAVAPLARTTLRALWLWCEQLSRDFCENCNGHGRWHDAGIICYECDGVGFDAPPAGKGRPGFFAGVAVDRDYLALALPTELGEPCTRVTLAVLPPLFDKAAISLVLDGGFWRVALAALDDGKVASISPEHRVTFHAEPVYAEMWSERHDPVTRAILADWLEERGDPYARALHGQPSTVDG